MRGRLTGFDKGRFLLQTFVDDDPTRCRFIKRIEQQHEEALDAFNVNHTQTMMDLRESSAGEIKRTSTKHPSNPNWMQHDEQRKKVSLTRREKQQSRPPFSPDDDSGASDTQRSSSSP